MKKLLLAVLFLPTIFACEAIWNNGPTQLLRDIFSITKTEGVDDLSTATKQSNSRWLRPKGSELWEIYSILDDSQRTKLTKKIKQSALAKAKMPTKKHYDVVVVLGATTGQVKTRIDFLVRLAERGITFDKVYLFGSTRDLNTGPELDRQMAAILKAQNINATEMAMLEYLWQQAVKPESLQALPVVSFQSGQHPDGTRANMVDILKVMINSIDNIKGKNVLFISNNPHICFQDAVVKRVLSPYGVFIETVGDAMSKESMENVLDMTARCLTNIQQRE